MKLYANRNRTLVSLIVFAMGFILVAFAANELRADIHDDVAASAEYAQLREMNAGAITAAIPATAIPAAAFSAASTGAASLSLYSDINPHFVGWIIVPGTSIDYPVVRGQDNSTYLNTTFSGSSNPAGAIFIDYRLVDGFDAPVSLIYGHNMRDGSMFAPLVYYLDQEFMTDNPEIIIMTSDGIIQTYRVYAARRTDAWDSVYSLGFDANENEQLLILSTCIDGADRNSRLLVYAGRVAS